MLRASISAATAAVRSILSNMGQSCQAFLGLTGAIVGSMCFESAGVAFLVTSSIGHALGMWRWYKASLEQAIIRLDA